MQLDTWCDFPIASLQRALFAVPLSRTGAIVHVWDGTQLKTVSEKSLSSAYLSLEERVTFRRRVMLFTSGQRGVIFYPTWDFNGPDLPYFGEWKPRSACPWDIDGRKLVADAKDRVLQMVEAAKFRGMKRLFVYEGAPHTLTLKRGWKLGSMAWLAFFAGVRKASEVAGMDIVAVTETNPYEGLSTAIEWCQPRDVILGDRDLACHPCDVFSYLPYDPTAASILKPFFDGPMDVFSWIPMSSYTSTLSQKHRNAYWSP